MCTFEVYKSLRVTKRLKSVPWGEASVVLVAIATVAVGNLDEIAVPRDIVQRVQRARPQTPCRRVDGPSAVLGIFAEDPKHKGGRKAQGHLGWLRKVKRDASLGR